MVRYLNPADYNPAIITKADKDFAKKTSNFHSKLETFTKSKKIYIGISVFGYENKEKHPICVSKKCCEEQHVDLLSIGEEEKRHYVQDFNTFIYDHTLHRGANVFVVIVYKLLVKKKY